MANGGPGSGFVPYVPLSQLNPRQTIGLGIRRRVDRLFAWVTRDGLVYQVSVPIRGRYGERGTRRVLSDTSRNRVVVPREEVGESSAAHHRDGVGVARIGARRARQDRVAGGHHRVHDERRTQQLRIENDLLASSGKVCVPAKLVVGAAAARRGGLPAHGCVRIDIPIPGSVNRKRLLREIRPRECVWRAETRRRGGDTRVLRTGNAVPRRQVPIPDSVHGLSARAVGNGVAIGERRLLAGTERDHELLVAHG